MSFKDCQILNLEQATQPNLSSPAELDHSSKLLEWIVENSFFKSEVFESTMDIAGQAFYRFSIAATDKDGNQYHGFGRSKIRLKAASIAAGEVIERYVAKKILKSQAPYFAKHLVSVSDAEISVSEDNAEVSLPSTGFHSSNGWAVHFSLKSAIENSVIESLERHTLLYSFLHSGWDGFIKDEQVPFQGDKLTPYVSLFSFGGFGAGIVATEGHKFLGRTFGYLCDDAEKLNGSEKWLNAFFESHGQWELLSADQPLKEDANNLVKYQRHYLTTPHQHQTQNTLVESKNISDIEGHILMLDLKKALDLSVPMFAAFSFGGNLIPLFFKQKLSAKETIELQGLMKSWELPTDLPESHPIL